MTFRIPSSYTITFSVSFIALLLLACTDANNDPVEQVAQQDLSTINIQSPNNNFVLGTPLAQNAPIPAQESISVEGLVRVPVSGDSSLPDVSVNHQSAQLTLVDDVTVCPTDNSKKCYRFAANIELPKGANEIIVSVTDILGGVSNKSIKGVIDYCRIGMKDPNVLAEIQDDPNIPQGNRCHEIDGCSAYVTTDDRLATTQARNNPMAILGGNNWAIASTAFGSGTVPIEEYFIHGQQPKDALPCNLHDVCYQTAASGKSTCDVDMRAAMRNVCAAAYPDNSAPDGTVYPLDYLSWLSQKGECTSWADSYYAGLGLLGQDAFDSRKQEYSPN